MKHCIILFWLAASLAWAGDVENDIKPKGKAQTIVFKEELRISPAAIGREDLTWVGARCAIAANNKGHMFIMDQAGCRILEFGADGKFLRQVGKKGEGPGEFFDPMNLTILEDQNIIVSDTKGFFPQFNYFDAELKYKDRKAMPEKGLVLFSAIFSPDAKHLYSYTMKPKDREKATIGGMFLTKDLTPVIKFHETDVTMITPAQMNQPGFWESYMAQWFRLAPTKQPMMCFDQSGKPYSAINGKYEVTRYTKDFKPELVFTKKYRPKPLDDAERDALVDAIRDQVLSSMPPQVHAMLTEARVRKAVELAEFPASKQPIYGLVPMEKGYLMVLSDYNAKTHASVADIFDPKGQFIGEVKLPAVSVNVFASYFGIGPRMFFKNNKAYLLEEDEDEEMCLVRYSYRIVPKK